MDNRSQLSEILDDNASVVDLILYAAKRLQMLEDIKNNSSQILPSEFLHDEGASLEYKILKLTEELVSFTKMSSEELKVLHNRYYTDIRDKRNKMIVLIEAQLKQYNDLKSDLLKWNPDNESHLNIKQFTLKLLETAIEKDCNIDRLCPAEDELPLKEWVEFRESNLRSVIEKEKTSYDYCKSRLSEHKKMISELRSSVEKLSK